MFHYGLKLVEESNNLDGVITATTIQEWCDDHLIKFRIITESELGIK